MKNQQLGLYDEKTWKSLEVKPREEWQKNREICFNNLDLTKVTEIAEANFNALLK